MVCPKCKAEYSDDLTRCPACGASLEDSAESSGDNPAGNARTDAGKLHLVPVWSGDDPSEFAAVKAALERAEIPFLDETREGYFLFPSFFSKMQVRVASSDLERADRAVRAILELPAVEDSGPVMPEEGGLSKGKGKAAADHPPERISENEPVREIWRGRDDSLGATVADCLRENGIAAKKRVSGEGNVRLMVRAGDETRAKEIIREITEGTQQ